MQEQCMLGNHASKQVCYWWAFQIIQCLNGNKSTHFMKCKSCCASVLHFPIHKQSHDSMIQKSSAPVTKALQPSFEGPPMAPANMETLVAESTQGTPSRFTLQNERFARPIWCSPSAEISEGPRTFFWSISGWDWLHWTLTPFLWLHNVTFLPSGISLPESFPRSHSLQPEAMLLRH